jgi:CRP-like cAMP-binding protein
MTEQIRNLLLNRLSAAEAERLRPRLERLSVPQAAVIAEPRDHLEHAYFPIGCVLSTIVVLQNGASVEAATTGNEGLVDIGSLNGRPRPPHRIIAQVAGDCLRIRNDVLRDMLEELPTLRKLMQRYCIALLHQTQQNSACNLRHSIEERMSRWLLVCADRAGREELDLTQEFLSIMLGVRRQSVNVTAGLLQRAGLIAYRRGGIRIVDRAGLEASACECYGIGAELYAQAMSA